MKKEEWNEGMNHLDPDLVEKYIEQKEKRRQKKKQRNLWLRLGAIAACLTLLVSAIIVVSMLRGDDTDIIRNPGTTADTGTIGNPNTLTSTFVFESFEAFEQHERNAGEKAVSYYYVPSSLSSDYELAQITKRDDVYVMVEYSVSSHPVSNEKLNEYDAGRLQTLICRYSLYSDGRKALEEEFVSKGYEAIEYEGKTYYRWDEHAENNPEKQVIGYEIAFLADGKLIFMHLPAVDTFENMMKCANVVKVDIN